MPISEKRLREIEQESGCLYFKKDGLKEFYDQVFENMKNNYPKPKFRFQHIRASKPNAQYWQHVSDMMAYKKK